MKTITLTEYNFFEEHDRLKAEGHRIIRCLQVDGNGQRQYKLIYI